MASNLIQRFNRHCEWVIDHAWWFIVGGLAYCIALFLFVNVTRAQEQPVCDKRAVLIERALKEFKEVPVAIGLTSAGTLIEVLRTEDGSHWSLFINNPNGVTCVVGFGEGWQDIKPVWPGPQS